MVFTLAAIGAITLYCGVFMVIFSLCADDQHQAGKTGINPPTEKMVPDFKETEE